MGFIEKKLLAAGFEPSSSGSRRNSANHLTSITALSLPKAGRAVEGAVVAVAALLLPCQVVVVVVAAVVRTEQNIEGKHQS